MSDLVRETCGYCKEYSNHTTTLIPLASNKSLEETVTFPVTLTQPYGDAAYGKFIPVVSVPGLIVVRRKSIYNSQFLTKVTANSVFDAWPVIVITLVMTLLAGNVMWFLVSYVLTGLCHCCLAHFDSSVNCTIMLIRYGTYKCTKFL